jgi:hypothetical protein
LAARTEGVLMVYLGVSKGGIGLRAYNATPSDFPTKST